MVRPAAARAHPPLHAQAPARRDRAGRGARFPALPVRLAARDRRTRGWKARTRWPRPSRSSKASRRRPGMGERNPAGARRRLRAGLARRRMPCGPRRLGAARTARRPGRPASARPPGAHHADRSADAPPCARCGTALASTGEDAAQPARQRRCCEFIRAQGASFFDELVAAPVCCARRSRRRLANWWRLAW